MNKLQNIGLLTMLSGLSEKDVLNSICEEAGEKMAIFWLQSDEDSKNKLLSCSEDVVVMLGDLLKEIDIKTLG
jgi:hypothetical protein